LSEFQALFHSGTAKGGTQWYLNHQKVTVQGQITTEKSVRIDQNL